MSDRTELAPARHTGQVGDMMSTSRVDPCPVSKSDSSWATLCRSVKVIPGGGVTPNNPCRDPHTRTAPARAITATAAAVLRPHLVARIFRAPYTFDGG